MKSMSSATPVFARYRVTRMALSGRYICLVTVDGSFASTRNAPPLSASSSAANTLAESKRGQQKKSMAPSVETSAADCMSPIRP